jgi:predicted nucleic acid-binding protein
MEEGYPNRRCELRESTRYTRLGDLLELKRVALRVEPQDPYLGQVLKIAVENRVTVYDSLSVAQAIAKKATLITSDERQSRVAERLNLEVEYIKT